MGYIYATIRLRYFRRIVINHDQLISMLRTRDDTAILVECEYMLDLMRVPSLITSYLGRKCFCAFFETT